MNVFHEGEVIVKTTIQTKNGVTFTNFPSYTCYCGQSEPTYRMGELEVAEIISQRLLNFSANAEALTVDFDKLNPDLIREIQNEIEEEWQEIIRENPKKRRRSGKSLEEIEKKLLATYLPQDAVSCKMPQV